MAALRYILLLSICGLFQLVTIPSVLATHNFGDGQSPQSKFEKPNLYTYFDGPYVLYKGNTARIISVRQGEPLLDFEIPVSELKSKAIKVYPNGSESDRQPLKPFDVKLFNYQVDTSWQYNQPSKLFAISDIECSFSNAQSILKAGGVIDDDYNWIFGQNHLVVNGDMFSRGFDMMPLLWLLYKLDFEAQQAGGKVHIIIGNHEAMNLKGDVRYVKQRYLDFCSNLGIDYSALFNTNSEIGRWLRTKNTIIKIGRNLIVHGGISAEFIEEGLLAQDVNSIVQRDLGKQKDELSEKSKFIFGSLGPHWFRGLVNVGEKRTPVFAKDMPKILSYFDVDRVIVGHCKYDNVYNYRNQMVIGIDVNHSENRSERKARVLLMTKNKNGISIVRVNDAGQFEQITDGNPKE